MSSVLKTASFAQVCSLVTDGTHGTPKTFPIGVPLVKGKDISKGYIDFSTCDHVSVDDHQQIIKRSKPEHGDTLFANIGNSLGDVAYIDTDREFSIKNVALFKPNPDLIDGRYLYFLLKSPSVQGPLLSQRAGAAQPFLGLAALRSFQVQYHGSLDTQRRIASILGGYDDLIEVNRRRVAVLEEMARGLFEEWFIRFRFPGYESVPIVNTPDGPLPQGWSFGPFTEAVDVLSGGTPKKGNPAFWGGGIPFFTPRDAPSSAWAMDTLATVTPEGVAKCNSKLYPAQTVFITARGTVGKVALAAEPMAMNQSCYALVGRGYPQYFVYGFTQFAAERLRAMSNGAVFDTIIVDTFRKLNLALPPSPLGQKYHKEVEPILDLSRVVGQAIKRLATSRDLLLPRLISGQLSVEAAERDLELAA